MTNEIERAAGLLERAFADGELSPESTSALTQVGNIGTEVGKALGDYGNSGDLLLVTIVADDTASISSIPKGVDAVCAGHNHCLEALNSEQGADVLIHTRCIEGGSLSPYRNLSLAVRLSAENYMADAQSTPLYRQTALTLGTVIAKAREQQERSRHTRTFTLLITDGEDNFIRSFAVWAFQTDGYLPPTPRLKRFGVSLKELQNPSSLLPAVMTVGVN